MYLSKKAIQEFAEIYKEDFGEEISLEEAEIMGERLLEFVSMIFYPPRKKGENQDKMYEQD